MFVCGAWVHTQSGSWPEIWCWVQHAHWASWHRRQKKLRAELLVAPETKVNNINPLGKKKQWVARCIMGADSSLTSLSAATGTSHCLLVYTVLALLYLSRMCSTQIRGKQRAGSSLTLLGRVSRCCCPLDPLCRCAAAYTYSDGQKKSSTSATLVRVPFTQAKSILKKFLWPSLM